MKNNEITPHLKNASFARKTCEQLNKEFERVGIALNLDTANHDMNQIVDYLAKELTLISEHQSSLFAQLIYSIDLPEQQVNTIMQTSATIMEDLAQAILVRVAQKIYLRERFSS